MDLFQQDLDVLKSLVRSASYNDAQTLQGMKDIYAKYDYLACPHTAIAWLALEDYKKENPDADAAGVFLSTAHACKFPDVFPEDMKQQIAIPAEVGALKAKKKLAEKMNADYEAFRAYLITSY